MPAFLELTFPMAVLLGVLMGFGRMSGDRELIAARACGMSLYRLGVPVLGVAIVVWAISSWLAFSVRPWANAHLREQPLRTDADAIDRRPQGEGLQPQFSRASWSTSTISPVDESLHGVMISDARNPGQQNTIIAQERLSSFRTRRTRRSRCGCSTDRSSASRATDNTRHVTSFHIYDLNVHPEAELGITERDPEEMSYARVARCDRQARAAGKPDHDAETEMASKFTLPFTTVLFALIGIPLGLKPARGGQSERFGVAIALFFPLLLADARGRGAGRRAAASIRSSR